MKCHHNKVVLFVLMAVITAAAQECANVKEACDFSPPINKKCCKGMSCSISFEKWVKKDTSLKGECEIDPDGDESEHIEDNNPELESTEKCRKQEEPSDLSDENGKECCEGECIIDDVAPMCREAGQHCGNLFGAPATSEDNMLELSTNTACCDNLECDSSSQKCRLPGLECRKEGQPCGNLFGAPSTFEDNMSEFSTNTTCCDNLECDSSSQKCRLPGRECRKKGQLCGNDESGLLDDYGKALLSSKSDCCPGLACGALGSCVDASKFKCIKEGYPCRGNECCGGINCNSVGKHHITGEEQYRCQTKKCQTTGSCDVFNNNCCDGHFCKYRFLFWAGSCLIEN
ncbi:unnamed protein product [Amaranthus hypochondriacus]